MPHRIDSALQQAQNWLQQIRQIAQQLQQQELQNAQQFQQGQADANFGFREQQAAQQLQRVQQMANQVQSAVPQAHQNQFQQQPYQAQSFATQPQTYNAAQQTGAQNVLPATARPTLRKYADKTNNLKPTKISFILDTPKKTAGPRSAFLC